MKIKDVEKLTGLTAKSIRYYESKGLIQVAHEENGYRSYSEEDVVSFKQIKILRYLEFGIEEIRHFLEQEEEEKQRLLREKAEGLQKQMDDYDVKRNLCLSLSKDYPNADKLDAVMEEYHETIDVLESEAWEEAREGFRDMGCMSLWESILYTGCFTGTIINLFMAIHDEKWDAMLFRSILALIGAVAITYIWIRYFHCRASERERQKKKNRDDRFVLPFIIIGSVAGIIVVAGTLMTPQFLFAPKDWLFYEIAPVASYGMIFLIVIPLMAALVALADYLLKKKQKDKGTLSRLFSFFLKHKAACLFLWLVLFYCCFSQVTFVTEKHIICHSPLHPAGIVYEYGDVSKVEAAFGGRDFSFLDYKRKGSFSYTIYLGKRKVVFTVPTDREDIRRYEEHTYLELEEFDQALMKCGVPKEGDDTYAKDCDLDQEYVDRFCRIIRLQSER